MKSVSLKITGRVQGVFFRASAKAKADELSLKGVVWNNPDGSVSARAEGNKDAVELFIAWCKHGPPMAKVQHCDVQDSEIENFTAFRIKT